MIYEDNLLIQIYHIICEKIYTRKHTNFVKISCNTNF
jgi:hypothetical protein